MSPNLNIKEYLDSKGLKYKEVINDQLNVESCPDCGDMRWHCYIHKITGLWDCKVTGCCGNFKKFKEKLGDIDDVNSTNNVFSNKQDISLDVLSDYQKNLQNCPEALDYLIKTRGFTTETIEKFKLGLEGDYIVIPHFFQEKLWNCKFRKFRGEKGFKRIAGQPSILFNLNNIDVNKKAVVIVESETDCIAATQMGISNVVGLTTGCQSFPPEWLPFVANFKQIYVCLNSDRPGILGAAKLIDKLGIARCKNVLLPVKDVNEYLLKEKELDPFYNFVKTKAENIKINDVSMMSDYIDNLDDWFDAEGSLSGMEIPFPRLNKLLNGFKEEDLIVLSGDNGVGKSTFLLNILNHLLKQGTKCFCFFLEGKIMFYILRMMGLESGKKIEDLRNDKEEWEGLKRQFASYPLYFYSGPQSDIDAKKIKELSEAVVKMHDIKFLAIDNLQEYVQEDRYVVQNTSEAVKTLKQLKIDLKISIFLINHIRKMEGKRRRPTKNDSKNSSAPPQKADIYLILWNNKADGALEDNFYLTLEKNRMGEDHIDIKMCYEKSSGRFYENNNLEDTPMETNKKPKKEDGFKAITKTSFENDEL